MNEHPPSFSAVASAHQKSKPTTDLSLEDFPALHTSQSGPFSSVQPTFRPLPQQLKSDSVFPPLNGNFRKPMESLSNGLGQMKPSEANQGAFASGNPGFTSGGNPSMNDNGPSFSSMTGLGLGSKMNLPYNMSNPASSGLGGGGGPRMGFVSSAALPPNLPGSMLKQEQGGSSLKQKGNSNLNGMKMDLGLPVRNVSQELLMPGLGKPLAVPPTPPGTLIEDKYGLLGLIDVIKMTNEDVSTLALGGFLYNFVWFNLNVATTGTITNTTKERI